MNDIRFNGVTFFYPGNEEYLLRKYSASFLGGTSCMVIGDNGSGKSTLGKLVCGIQKPSGGSILISGISVHNLKGAERINKAYYITQINQLQFINNSLTEEIRFAERIAGKRLEPGIYEYFHLPIDTSYNPFELNVNEAWRFSLLIACIVNPQVLFIDEIPSASNTFNRNCLTYILSKRKKENKITFVAYQRQINLTFDSTLLIEDVK